MPVTVAPTSSPAVVVTVTVVPPVTKVEASVPVSPVSVPMVSRPPERLLLPATSRTPRLLASGEKIRLPRFPMMLLAAPMVSVLLVATRK